MNLWKKTINRAGVTIIRECEKAGEKHLPVCAERNPPEISCLIYSHNFPDDISLF
ncbi:MAG: hypothetical protein GXY48_13015 [Methanomicrobiales archaeon]|nr:hypothetical protein [Methanomicrobiales archaeon]